MDVSNVSTPSANFKYLLVSIDIFTRKVCVVPLKSKDADTVAEGMKTIIKTFSPKIVTTDVGKEYISSEFNNLLKRHGIEHRYIDVDQHCSLGLVDRMCRTIRGLVNKWLTSRQTTRYIDVLDQLIENYNNTYHSTIKCTPNEAENHVKEINRIMLNKYNQAKTREPVFNIGDRVRNMLTLSIFDKQGKSKWSKDIYTIVDSKTHSYKLSNGKWYRYYQLSKVDEVNKIEKERPEKHTMESLKKERTTERRRKKEGVHWKILLKDREAGQ